MPRQAAAPRFSYDHDPHMRSSTAVNTAYFRCFDCFGVLLPLCSVSFFESVFVMA